MKYLINIAILFLAMAVSAQEPETDAIYQKIVKKYTLNKDGSIDFHYYKKMKYLTPYAFNRLYGETFIVYNPEFQKITINLASTYQEDGTVIENPDNAFNEVLPRFAAKAPYYNQLREMVVTHAGLEVNAIVELDYTIHTKPGYYPSIAGMEPIKENVPVIEEEIVFSVHENIDFNYKVYNIRTSPKVIKRGEQKIYRFAFNGLSAKKGAHEQFPVSNGTDQPYILYSTVSMEDIYKSLTGQDAFQYKVNEKMIDVVNEAKKGVGDDIDLALNIQAIVANNVNYYPILLSYSGFRVRPAIETFNSNGGTQLEKCILLCALLRESGINAEPVMVVPSTLFDENIGCIPHAAEFIVQVNPRETKQLYLSAVTTSSQNQIYNLAGKTVFTLNASKPLRIEKMEQVENKIKLTGGLKLDDSLKLNGQFQLLLSGRSNPYFDLKKDSSSTKKLISGGLSEKDILKSWIKGSSQLRSEVGFDIQQDTSLKRQKNYSFFTLPTCNQGIETWHMNYLMDKRNSILQVPMLISESYDFAIQLPEDMDLVNPVDKIEKHYEFGELIIEISQSGREVKIIRSIEISYREVQALDYQKFKEMMDLWNERQFRELVFKSTY